MFGKEKKPYRTPDIQKISLSDEEVTAVSGGISKRKTSTETTTTPTVDTTGIQTGENAVNMPSGGAGNGDVGRGRGRGGGCDGVPYHRNQRTFSSGRNSGC